MGWAGLLLADHKAQEVWAGMKEVIKKQHSSLVVHVAAYGRIQVQERQGIHPSTGSCFPVISADIPSILHQPWRMRTMF